MTERETEVDFTFHFSCFACCLNKRCQRQTGVFTMLHFVQSFVARCCKMQCVRGAEQSERPLILSRQ